MNRAAMARWAKRFISLLGAFESNRADRAVGTMGERRTPKQSRYASIFSVEPKLRRRHDRAVPTLWSFLLRRNGSVFVSSRLVVRRSCL